MATPITKFVSVTTNLATKVVPAASLETGLYLGTCAITDDPIGSVPIDQRYQRVTKDDFEDYFDETSAEYAYCLAYFGQTYVPDELIVGRLIGADSASYTVLSGGTQVYKAYTALTSSVIKFIDNSATPKTDEVPITTLAGCTSFAGVLNVLNACIADVESPNITGLETGVFMLDNLDRLVFVIPTNTGKDAIQIHFTTPSAGTDLISNSYLGATATVVPGYDAETMTAAVQDLKDLTSFYNIAVPTHGVTGCPAESQYTALAAYIETQRMQLDICTNDAESKSALVTDDLASLLKAASYDRTTVYYSERVGERPDGANAGYVFPQKSGAVSFAYRPLSGVSESGLTKALTSAEMTALDDKHVLYVCTVGDVNFVYKSLTSSGEEKRLILGIDWFDITCQTDIINAQITASSPLTYDYNTFGIIESIIRKNAKEAAARNIIYAEDDKNYPFTVTMPDPTSFSAAVKKTHVFSGEIYNGSVKSEILNWQITGKFSI